MEEGRSAFKILTGKPTGKRSLGRPRRRWEDNIRMDLEECKELVQTLLSSRLLSKNLKIKIYIKIVLPVVLYGCETWYLTFRENAG